MNELYMNDGKLIAKDAWEELIISIRKAVKEDLQDKETAKKTLIKELVRAVNERIPENNSEEKFGVLFSGGVDSSLIALLLKKAGRDFTCYTLGFKDADTKEPEDLDFAQRTAGELGLRIRTRTLDVKEAEELIKKTVKILGKELNNVVNVGVGGVVLGCIEMAKQDGVKYLFSGLGSEEIFAGYHRHRLSDDRQAECWQGLINMYERDLLRDAAVASGTGVQLLTPFLDEKLIAIAMRVPAKHKMNDDGSKLILREAAEELGLPKSIAWRAKRAAQYGSRLDKAISKIARQKKFKYKKDYLKSLESS
jgi:asparagine synthetase B (glutamine-hydrolysing)